MKKWVNNSLWLVGGIVLGGMAVSEDTATSTQPVEPTKTVQATVTPKTDSKANTAKLEAAKARLDLAEAKLKEAEHKAKLQAKSKEIMNAERKYPLPDPVEITLCQSEISKSFPNAKELDVETYTSFKKPNADNNNLYEVWFRFYINDTKHTGKCIFNQDIEIISSKYE